MEEVLKSKNIKHLNYGHVILCNISTQTRKLKYVTHN